MLDRVEISGIHMELTEEMKKYADKKIGKLDKYLPKHARLSAHAEVKLSQDGGKKGSKQYYCEVIMHLPNETITAKDATLNIFAAIDIVEAKLKNQLRKYKEKNKDHRSDRKGFLGKLRKMADADYRGSQN